MSARSLRRLPALPGAVSLWLLITALPLGAQTSRLIAIERGSSNLGPPGRRVERMTLPSRIMTRLHTGPSRQARSLGYRPGDAVASPDLPDTMRVLVLRLSFTPDEDPATTGDGTFDLRSLDAFTAQEEHQIDATPHDRGYVERHLLALHHYWWAMSGGRFSIAAAVYPRADTLAFQLPHPMSRYGFTSPLGDILTAYEALVSDAVAAAEAGVDPIDWSAFDALVLFHAGADWQGDVNRDTPADLPTAWLMLGTPVAAGGTLIADAIVIPETVSQDGYIGAINGVFAHEFGHQLGLPDLYDTAAMSPAVGLWALMDSGNETGGVLDEYYVWGILPASLSPWTRMWLGWTEPVVIGPGESTVLVASTALDGVHSIPAAPRLALVPAGEEQAFLIELRADDLDGEPDVSLYWEEGVIDGTARLEGGEKVRTYEYDALLPGSGVLIWHLDAAVASADPEGDGFPAFADNTLQADRLRRFLDIEEADGLQELGWVPGYLGEANDLWRPDPTGPSRFGPFTEPATTTWTGAFTGLDLAIEDHPSPLAVTLRVTGQGSFPVWTAPLSGGGSEVSVPWLVDADGDGSAVVAVLDSAGGLHLFDPDGTPRGSNPVWTAPAAPAASLTLAGSLFAVVAGQQIHFVSEEGLETAAVDLGHPVAGRPTGERSEGRGTLVPLTGGLLVEVDPTGILDSWSPGQVSFMLETGLNFGRLAATGNQLWSLHPGGEMIHLWNAAEPIVSMALVGVGDVLAILDAGGVLTLLQTATDLETVTALSTLALGQECGSIALMPLPGSGHRAFIVPTGNGIKAFDDGGYSLADWPPRAGGRAAVEPPLPVGVPLTLSNGVVCTMTEAAELLFYDLHARQLFGGARALPSAPAADPTLARGSDGFPRLLVPGVDSLRVYSLTFTDLYDVEVIWAGPQGCAGAWGTPGEYWAYLPYPEESWERTFYAWPNPARRQCRLRLEGFEDREVTFLAFTSIGTSLGKIGALTATGSIAEFTWDVSDLAPGVYRVVAEISPPPGVVAGGFSRMKTKVMVIR